MLYLCSVNVTYKHILIHLQAGEHPSNTSAYPLPAVLGHLLELRTVTNDDNNVHPALLKNATTESLIKFMKFGLWVNYQTRQSKSIRDVIDEELQLYDLEPKEQFQASTTYITIKLDLYNHR
jgi:hypothetical protein